MIQFSQSPQKIFSLAFFNILIELLLVQKPTIHQQKAWDLSYLEPEGHGSGMVRRVPPPLDAKDIEKKKEKLTELSQDAKFFIFDLIFNILMLWAKCMLINFEFQQSLFCILTNCQTKFAILPTYLVLYCVVSKPNNTAML